MNPEYENKKNVKQIIDNEGFLYIDNTFHDVKEESAEKESAELIDTCLTFKKGLIMDINNKTVCPGEIVPIMDYEQFERDKNKIHYYTPLLKGKKVRFYKVQNNLSSVIAERNSRIALRAS